MSTQRRTRPKKRSTSRTRRLENKRRSRLSGWSVLGLLLILGCILGFAGCAAAWVRPPMNLLILGVDRRPGESSANHTDTLLLLRVDSRKPSIKLLSIPRDLWVSVPGYGENRINTAYFFGEIERPGDGLNLAAKTIEANFDVPVHHTLRLDFQSFKSVIDAAGGIYVDVPYAIVDTAYPTDDYGVITIQIPAGRQHMDGETALRYARTRHGSSDFARAARQQQVLVALGERLASPASWFRLPKVNSALRQAFGSDLSSSDLLQLGVTLARVGAEGIEHNVIDENMTTPFMTAQGAAVLLPQWEKINPLVGGW